MFMVTQKEERAIQGIESIYCSLQKSVKTVMATLQYNDLIIAQNQKKSFWQRLFPKKSEIEVANQDLHELLDALIILKSIFEENMPIIIDGKLYFRFQSLQQGRSLFYQIGAAQTEFDLISYFKDLTEKMTNAMALPKVNRAMNSPLLSTYCPSIARAKTGLWSCTQGYLNEKKTESAAIQSGESTSLRVVG